MAKISELSNGGNIQDNDLFLISRGVGNFFIKGETVKSMSLSSINVSGVINGSAVFSNPSSASIITTLSPIPSGFSNNVIIDDGSGQLKKRTVNPFVWNTASVPPVTSTLMSDSFIAKAVSPNGITNSIIKQDSSGNIGVGINPNVELTVNGQISSTNHITSVNNVISELNLISKQDLTVDRNSTLGSTALSFNTIRGKTSIPDANSTASQLQIGSDCGLYRSQANVLKTDDNFAVGTLGSSLTSNDILVHEAGILKSRSVNPFVWNIASSPIAGNLTTSFVPKASSSSGLVNSVIREDASGNVGIGMTPNVELTVNGQISSTESISSGLDLISNRDLTVKRNSVLGSTNASKTTIRGESLFPDASSAAFALKLGSDVNLYRSRANTLQTDDNFVVGTLVTSVTSNDIIVEENGLLKTRSANPFTWNLTASFLSGAGTNNYVPKYLTPTSLGNSSIYETAANNIGIGTTSVNQKLTISGNLSASGTGIVYAKTLSIGSSNVTEAVTISGGNVDILNSTEPAFIRLTQTTGDDAVWEMRSYHTDCQSRIGGPGNEFSIYGGIASKGFDDRFIIDPNGDVLVKALTGFGFSNSNQLIVHESGYLKTRPIPVDFIVACSDETTKLLSGAAVTFRAPYAMHLAEVRASVNQAPTGAPITVNIKQNGVSIFSTLLSIDVLEKTSVTASVPAVISTSNITDDAEIAVSVAQVGSTFPGKGLKLTFKGYRK